MSTIAAAAATRIVIIYNPNAGGAARNHVLIERLTTALAEQGFTLPHISVQGTKAAGEATHLARQAVANKADVLIICGGDGTINEAAQAVVGTQTVLAVLPCGTANVLAKEMRLPQEPEIIARMIAERKVREISVGLASKPDEKWNRYFLLMAGIGLDATIIEAVNPTLKKQWGIGSYIAAGLKMLAKWVLQPFTLSINDHQYKATFAIVANAANYAAWFTIAPNSRLDSDHLNVCLFNTQSRLIYLGYAFLSLFGAHTKSADVIYEPIHKAFAESDNKTPVQLDGELVGHLPMKFECVPHALRLIA